MLVNILGIIDAKFRGLHTYLRVRSWA
jgi:hypothetical protein